MRLNEKETAISAYTSEILDNEMVLYNEATPKIIILNHTAMLVWNEILEGSIQDLNISTKDIAKTLMMTYELSELELESVCQDVEETIELLYQAELLIECVTGEE